MKNVSFKLILCVSLLAVAFGPAQSMRCDPANGKCKCPKLQAIDTNRADVNPLGICDTDLECSAVSCDPGNGYCDKKDGKCKCPKLQAIDTNGADVNHLGICDTDLECYSLPCQRGNGYCDQKDGKCKCPK